MLFSLVIHFTGCGDAHSAASQDTACEKIEETSYPAETENTLSESTEQFINVRNDDEIYYLEDKEVREIPLFLSFLNGEISAYDKMQQTQKYYNDYFKEAADDITGVHLMVADLDDDGKEELLVNIMYSLWGTLVVFHEKDGMLCQWEIFDSFFMEDCQTVTLYSNGIMEWQLSRGHQRILWQYNKEGQREIVYESYCNFYTDEEGKNLTEYVIAYYENGKEDKSFQFLIDDDNQVISGDGDRENITEMEEEILSDVEEVRKIVALEYEPDAEVISREEFLNQLEKE